MPVLSVTPASQEVTGESGLITFVVSNAGTGTLNWRAEADVSWLTIKSGASGTDSGAIAVSHEANTGAERTGTLTVTAIGAENSPLTLDVNQVGSVNQAPTDIALSKTRVEEKMPAGTKVGSFSTSDPDSGDTHTHTLVSGSGAADNESFRIQGTHLETADMFDYNVKNSYAIRVKTDDGHGGTFEKAFTITIDDANDDPTDIILDNSALDENQPVGTEVGTYATTDPDESDTHTYTLIISDNASFRIQGNTLSTQKILDYETKNSYSIRVRTDDGRGGSFEKDFSIIVIDNNDKPTDITLDHNLITEGLPIGSAVGAFVATDQDQGDTHTYDLVPGAGGDGNDFFFIEHSTLKANAEFTYIEQNRYNIRVRATDSWDESYDKQFTLMITAAPTAAFAPADGQKDVELNGNITLTFSKPVRLLNDTPLTSVNVDSLILFKKDDPTGKNVPFNATINSGKTVITINPDADMESRQSYHVAIEATVEDYENNPLAPASAVFVTEDTEPPVVTITPMDGTKDVPSTKDIVIEFDEPVRFIDGRQITNINVDGLITFRKTDSDGDDVPFDAVIDTRKMVITIRPGMELESNQTYHMAIGATVEDYSGNSGEAADVTFTVLAIFSDISAELTGVARKSAVAWGDYDNDGDPDILLSGYDYDIPPQGESVAKVYRNTNGTFASIPAGLIGVYFGSVSWGDYDRDSDMDILLTGSNSPKQRSVAKIYRNNNGKFEAVSAGLAGIFQGFAAWKDYDGDADPDILLAGGYETTDGDVTGIAVIYRNDAGQFEKIDVGLTGVYYASGGWGDYDTDGDPDILLTGHDGEARISKVYRNDDGEFTDIEADLPGISSGCAAWGDYNGDGHPDILLTGKTDDGEISKVYRNDAGTFADAYADLPDVYNSSAAWGDYDNDGYLDILLTGENADGKISEVYRYDDETETFTAINAGLIGVSNGAVAWGDYDNDGYPDILLTGEYEETRIAKIYHNNLGNPAEIQDDGHLGNAIMALKILAGMPAPYYGDLDGDGKVGMAEVIDELGRAAGQW